MRHRIWLLLSLALAACTSAPSDSSKLTLRNMQWDHVNVQVVVTRGSDCDNPGPDFVKTQNFVLVINQTRTIVAPNETTVCWRHDRYPANPHPGEWSGWSKAIPFPNSDATTDL